MRIVVGRIGRAQGVRGEVAVQIRTDDPDVRFASGSSLYVSEDGAAVMTVLRSRWQSGRLIVAFEGVADRTAAESLAGTVLYRDADDAVDEVDAWYDHDLIGCQVKSGGAAVGTVADVVHLPSQDMLSVRLQDGAVRLVPLVAELVPDIDVANRVVTVNDLPGLLFDIDGG